MKLAILLLFSSGLFAADLTITLTDDSGKVISRSVVKSPYAQFQGWQGALDADAQKNKTATLSVTDAVKGWIVRDMPRTADPTLKTLLDKVDADIAAAKAYRDALVK